MRALTTGLLLIAFLNGYAQFNTTTIRTPYGNTKVMTYTPQRLNYYGQGAITETSKYEFTVVLQGDTTIVAKAKIDLSTTPDTMRIKVNGKKRDIVPSETKEVFRVMPDGYKLSGIPTDSCWLFNVIDRKKINAYSDNPVRGYMYVIAIQSGDDGVILPLTIDNLKKLIGETDDPKLLKMIEKKKVLSALARFNGDVF